MIEAVIPIFFIGLCLIGIEDRKDIDTEFLSVEQGNILKGIAALLLIIVHLRERLEIIPVAYKGLAAGGVFTCSIILFLFWFWNIEADN